MKWPFSRKGLPHFDEHISRAIGWFYNTWVDNETGTGWGHFAGLERVTEWGGTLEGIRALVRVGENKNDHRIAKAISWLKSVQQQDGGWKSWEIRESCVEPTAWALITLRLCDESLDSKCFKKGIGFLIKATNVTEEHCYWGAYEGADPRVYPTLLAIWALSGIRDDLSAKGAKWLKASRNSDGGWGFRPNDEISNIAMTAMAVYVLLTTKQLFMGEMLEKTLGWIRSHLRNDGTWPAAIEDWISCLDPDTKDKIPAQTKHFSTAWALMALIKANVPISDPKLSNSLAVLAKMQEENGSWIFSRDDPKEYSWCVANAMWALADACDAFYSPVGFTSYVENIVSKSLRRATYMSIINLSLIILTIFGGILYLSGAYQGLLDSLAGFVAWLSGLVASIARELVIAIIATAVISSTIAIYRWLKKRQTRGEEKTHE